MCFFATIMLAVLFLQDTKKHTYELLHTKPITAGKYVFGKVSAGFAICLIALTIINLLFWALCVIYTKDSGFEVRFWDFYSFYCTLYTSQYADDCKCIYIDFTHI